VVAATGVGVVRDVVIELPRNGYGLCSGSSDGRPDEAGVLPLTDWLHGFFQSVANREPAEPPVTFGDLWGTRDERAERDIELVLMTTNITRGISQRLPFLEGSWGQLFFKEAEFAKLFPASPWSSICARTQPMPAIQRISIRPASCRCPRRRTCRSCSARA
jgi:hypothetical protein